MIKASVCVIIYNHGKFIRQCLESIFRQEVHFEVEVIISDDKSKDDSVQQVNDFLSTFLVPPNFHIIKMFHATNMGMNQNWRSAIEKATGEYITIIEGDDYWEGNRKLVEQVTFLDDNLEYSGTANETKILNTLTGQTSLFIRDKLKGNIPNSFGIEEYLTYDCLCHTSSLVYRNSWRGKRLPDLIDVSMSLDQAVFVLFNQQNQIKYFPVEASVYRVHAAGITQSNRHQNIRMVTENQIRMFTALNVATNYRWDSILRRKINKLRFELLRIRLYLPHMKRWVLKKLRS